MKRVSKYRIYLSHPSLEWNVWCHHSIVDKWQTLEAARHCIAQWKSIHHVCERSRVQSPALSLSKFTFETCQLPPSNHPLLYLASKIMVWCHISLQMICTAGLKTPQSWSIMTDRQAYLVWPLGKVKCFDMLHPSLEWNVWCCHSIVDKWQTLEAARHHIAQWKSIHRVCERSRVWSPVLSLSKFMFKTCQLPPSINPLL